MVKPWWAWFVQRTALALIEQVTCIGLLVQALPVSSGTGFELQSNWRAGLPGAWMATPHVMLPPSAVHKSVREPDPRAGVARARAQATVAIGSRHTRASSHARRAPPSVPRLSERSAATA